jgi:O-antigen biosynthesis protein WbqP
MVFSYIVLKMLKRLFDLLLVLAVLPLLLLPLLALFFAIRFTSLGPALYWSKRIGQKNREFLMPKFRSMRVGTPAVAPHLLNDPKLYLTPIGSFFA